MPSGCAQRGRRVESWLSSSTSSRSSTARRTGSTARRFTTQSPSRTSPCPGSWRRLRGTSRSRPCPTSAAGARSWTCGGEPTELPTHTSPSESTPTAFWSCSSTGSRRSRRRRARAPRELARMARKRRRKHLRPKTPARVRKAKRSRRARGRQHPELIGLALLALGLFLAVVLWLEWDGGIAGEEVDAGLDALVGGARLAIPLVLAVLGGLMVARAALVDVRPFRTGLVVLGLGVMTILGEERGGVVGSGLEAIFGKVLGDAGTNILGAFLVVAGAILITGASIGALLSHSAHAARRTAAVARRSVERVRVPPPLPVDDVPHGPPIDAEQEYPDVVAHFRRDGPELSGPRGPTISAPPTSEHADYRPPDTGVLRRSKTATGSP